MAGRRSNGEGTLFKRADGKYVAKLEIGRNENGTAKYKYFTSSDRAVVLQKWEEAKGTVRTGTFCEPSKILFKDYTEEWLTAKERSIRDSTFVLYRGLIDSHIKGALGGIKLQQLAAPHIQNFYNSLAPQTCRNVHKVVSGTLQQAIREHIITVNPLDAIILPKIEEKEMQVLSVDQANTLLETAKNRRNYAAFLLEIYTGIRRGELLGLRWKDVDIKEFTVSIVQQLVKVGSKHILRELKTKGSKRVIAVPELVITALQAHKKIKTAELKEQGRTDIEIKKMLDEGLVFTTSENTPIQPDNFVRSYKFLLKAAGLPGISFHTLRHTFAVLSLQGGCDIKTLQSDLGHRSITTTLDRYGHTNMDMKRSAADKRSSLLGN